jgi:hypothetical protein
VTPLDREDIHALARSLDDVMDAIDASATLVRLYRSTACASARASSRRSSRLADRCARARGARAAQGVIDHAVEINRLENEADRCTSRPSAPVRRRARSDRRDEVEGDARLPRGRHRSLRGRGERARGRHGQARIARCCIVVGADLRRALFDYINGFHDAANSIATVVSTRVLSPGKAVIWAAFFNFVAAFTFGTAVAKTVGSGMIDIKIVTFAVDLRRAGRRDHLGPDHLVLRAADQLVARADRRLRRRRGRQGRVRGDHPGRLDQDAHLHRPVAAHRLVARLR